MDRLIVSEEKVRQEERKEGRGWGSRRRHALYWDTCYSYWPRYQSRPGLERSRIATAPNLQINSRSIRMAYIWESVRRSKPLWLHNDRKYRKWWAVLVNGYCHTPTTITAVISFALLLTFAFECCRFHCLLNYMYLRPHSVADATPHLRTKGCNSEDGFGKQRNSHEKYPNGGIEDNNAFVDIV